MKYAADFRAEARDALRGRWPIAILTGFVASLIGASIATSGGGRSNSNSDSTRSVIQEFQLTEFWLQYRTIIIAVLVVLVIWLMVTIVIGGAGKLGYAIFNLKLVDNKNVDFKDLFSQFHRLGDGFCMNFLVGLYTVLWTLLFIIPGIIKGYSYAMTPYILAENPGMTATEAITESRRIMDGNKWRLFCLGFSFIGWGLLCAAPILIATGILTGVAIRTESIATLLLIFPLGIPLGAGYLFLMPYQEAAWAALDDPYYLYLSDYVKQGCLERKYALIPLERKDDLFIAPEAESLNGIIAVGLFTPKQIESLSAISPNVVFLDSSPFESRFDSVVLNYDLGISLAMEHLIQLNHRKIGFVGPTFRYNGLRGNIPELRRQSYCKLMEKYGLQEELCFIDCPLEVEPTIRAWKDFLHSGRALPSAVICGNEDSAIGTIQCLTQEGYSVPKDISVVSFNDTPRSALLTPPLTSVSVNESEMANTALRLVSERAILPEKEAIRTIPLKVVIPLSLVVRESSLSADK